MGLAGQDRDTFQRMYAAAICRQIEHELDFRNEAANATRLAECMAGRQDVTAPRIFPELCTRRVLTMEW